MSLFLGGTAAVHLEPSQTSTMEQFAKTVSDFEALTIFAKGSILDAWQGSQYVFEDLLLD